ncbi:TonB family protein [Microvirga roseola]|uniref:TonB family protein n=1 Tax=Microvirga roseola TaxID=2883126 RepID=UPI001E41EDE3|nr:TonB family protein [Microvirga roseola]
MNRFASAISIVLLTMSFSACMTAMDGREDLRAAFQHQVGECYVIPAKARGEGRVVVEVRLNPNGSLAQPPQVIEGSPTSTAAQAALRALERCTPFAVPAEMRSRYRDWRVMRIGFETE